MAFATTDLIPILPELVTLVTACTILLVDLFLKEEQKGVNHTLAILGLLAAIGATWVVGGGERQAVFDGSFVRDGMSDVLIGYTLLITLLTFVYSRD